MTVIEVDGTWAVTDARGNVVAKFTINEAAWRWIDRQERRPLCAKPVREIGLFSARQNRPRPRPFLLWWDGASSDVPASSRNGGR